MGCSGNGMALTGFTRTGQCVDRNDDAGSHHVCIDMKSNTGGNFCSVTGQPNWCGSQMACDGAGCVCQWAFASYLQRAGGATRSRQWCARLPTWLLSLLTVHKLPMTSTSLKRCSVSSKNAVLHSSMCILSEKYEQDCNQPIQVQGGARCYGCGEGGKALRCAVVR